MANTIIPFPAAKKSTQSRASKRDRRRKLPANCIDFVEVLATRPGDVERDIRECKETLFEYACGPEYRDQISGVIIALKRGNSWKMAVSGDPRYDTGALLWMADKMNEMAEKYAAKPLLNRIFDRKI